MCAQILGFSRVRLRVSIRVSLVYLVCATTLGNNWRHLFVRTENSEIQLLISVPKDGK